LQGEIITVNVKKYDFISVVKEKIKEKLQIATDIQMLVFGGKQLMD
jgi:hypothetical protein